MRQFVLVALVASLSPFARGAGNSVEATLEEPYTVFGPEVTAVSTARGKAEAESDIKAGHFRICDCGEPSGKRETDTATGYSVERVALCDHRTNSNAFDAEVSAYNQTMREWHTKHK
jgi:hypothetical protein